MKSTETEKASIREQLNESLKSKESAGVKTTSAEQSESDLRQRITAEVQAGLQDETSQLMRRIKESEFARTALAEQSATEIEALRSEVEKFKAGAAASTEGAPTPSSEETSSEVTALKERLAQVESARKMEQLRTKVRIEQLQKKVDGNKAATKPATKPTTTTAAAGPSNPAGRRSVIAPHMLLGVTGKGSERGNRRKSGQTPDSDTASGAEAGAGAGGGGGTGRAKSPAPSLLLSIRGAGTGTGAGAGTGGSAAGSSSGTAGGKRTGEEMRRPEEGPNGSVKSSRT